MNQENKIDLFHLFYCKEKTYDALPPIKQNDTMFDIFMYQASV